MRSSAGVHDRSRRAYAAFITFTALSIRYGSTPVSVTKEKLGTKCGGRPETAIMLQKPTYVPVISRVPIASFTWSPISDPKNCRPVGTLRVPTLMLTSPYVFFRLLVLAPAPKFTHLPT